MSGFFRALVRPQVQRTCKQCGYSWMVPRYLTKHHLESGTASSGRIFAGSSDWKMIAAPSEQSLEMKAELARCARCSSSHYTQKRMWSITRGEFDGDDS